jgi:hypothetical protein
MRNPATGTINQTGCGMYASTLKCYTISGYYFKVLVLLKTPAYPGIKPIAYTMDSSVEDFMKKKSLIFGMIALLAASSVFTACPVGNNTYTSVTLTADKAVF